MVAQRLYPQNGGMMDEQAELVADNQENKTDGAELKRPRVCTYCSALPFSGPGLLRG